MKIVLVGELCSKNLGEPLLFDCTQYCLQSHELNLEVIKADFFGRLTKNDNMKLSVKKENLIVIGLTIIERILKNVNAKIYFLNEIIWKSSRDKKRIEKFLIERFTGSDGIIIMGAGTLKYDVRLDFSPYYGAVIECASKLNIPVYINSVGVESKYNHSDRRCRMFEKYLNYDCVKIVTTRDDLATLRQYIHNPGVQTDKISDIGVWAAETYGIKKDEKSEIIGLGMITPERFTEFGRKISPEKYEQTWLDIIRLLDEKGIKWRIFNNGDTGDRQFAEKICMMLNKEVKDYVISPENPNELVSIISKFKGIITSRLHSCIVAYSLAIPFVAISWNNKLKFFANEIQCTERIVEDHEFEAKTVVARFEDALNEGYDMIHREKFRESSMKYIPIYLNSIKNCKLQEKSTGYEKVINQS